MTARLTPWPTRLRVLARRAAGYSLVGCGGLLTVSSFIAAGFLFKVPEWLFDGTIERDTAWLVGLAAVCGYVGVYAGSRVYRTGWRVAQPSAQEILDAGRPYVLLLRSFQIDENRLPIPEGYERQPQAFLLAGSSLEEEIVYAFKSVAPAIAVGRPGEELPPMGAARIYVTDAEWQHTVHRLMDGARVILIVVAGTGGVLWEASRALEERFLDRVVLYVPIVRTPQWEAERTRKEWQVFRDAVNPLVGHALPERLGAPALIGFVRKGAMWQLRLERGSPAPEHPALDLRNAASRMATFYTAGPPAEARR